ncbi:MAG: DUF4398 domain-containing protein [Deltaproteobacteria bacterium]|nr:DUF4398 domain-containing protein [Deltaproteobacteria bacterium]
MKHRFALIVAGVTVAGFLAGCAPTAALKSARDAYTSAKTAGAKDKAPYEFYAAKVYLDLAEGVSAEKAYSEAKVFAQKSQEFSRQAFEKAGGGVK